MNLHRKSIQDSRQNRIARKPKATCEEVPKHDNFSIPENRNLFVQWSSPSARRKEPSRFIFPNHIGRDLRFSENERGRQRSRRPCPDQISDAGIHISNIFLICSNFAILTAPGTTGSGRAFIFGRRSILRTLDDWFDWETSRDKFLSHHRSHGAFDSSHLFGSFTGKEKIKTTFTKKICKIRNLMKRTNKN
jgi:hypothetical protein